MGPLQELPLRVRADLGVTMINGNSTFPETPGLEPHHQKVSRNLLFFGVRMFEWLFP